MQIAPTSKEMSFLTFRNVFTGISQGAFDVLRVRDASGQMVNILTLTGGGGGSVTSVVAPLILNSGSLSLDTSGIASSAASPLSLTNGHLTIDLTAYSTTSQITQALLNYVTTAALTNSLAGKISTSHEANKLGLADVDHSSFGLTLETLTLKTPQGVTAYNYSRQWRQPFHRLGGYRHGPIPDTAVGKQGEQQPDFDRRASKCRIHR